MIFIKDNKSRKGRITNAYVRMALQKGLVQTQGTSENDLKLFVQERSETCENFQANKIS